MLSVPGGCLITFEGIDGCGKSVQASALANRLSREKYAVETVREPGGTALSEKIRDIILDRGHMEMAPAAELFLYEAARAQLMSQHLAPLLDSGAVVICDRFTDSTTAYQGYGRELDAGFIRQANGVACRDRYPDITFYLDIPWEESLRRRARERRDADRMEMEQKAFFQRVKTGYAAIAHADPGRVNHLDGMRSIEELENKIYVIVRKKLDSLRGVTDETENPRP
ncbi:dTMP kinase [bacterium]|nr:dTMP kinase [bacterium]